MPAPTEAPGLPSAVVGSPRAQAQGQGTVPAQASPEGQAMRDACLSGVAIARREPAGCEMVESPVIRDSCYMMLVVQFGADRKVCGQIRNETLKQACGE